MGLSQRVAIVTGVTSGIGEAVTRRLVADGWRVVGIGRRPDVLAALAAELGPALRPESLDVADLDALVALVRRVAGDEGRIDLVVNNAGVARALGIAESDPVAFAEVTAVNLHAPAAVIHAAWHALCASAGCVVNVSSLAQFDPFPGFFAYAASKAGLHLLSVVAANEGAEHGVRAFTVAPGVVDTPLFQRLMPEGLPDVDGLAASLRPEQIAAVVADVVAGAHDDRIGWVLAVPAPAARSQLQGWVDAHPGGGVVVLAT